MDNGDNSLNLSLSPPTTTIPPPPPAATPPFPWSSDLPAKVRSLHDLRALRISHVSGEVRCKRCNGTYRMELDLEEKFNEVATFFVENIDNMNTRAPQIWTRPPLPNCRLCQKTNSVRPIISEDNDSINWLFLFLGQMLGCCTIKHLKYFLQHANKHRAGSKMFLVFCTYEELLKQLLPEMSFDV